VDKTLALLAEAYHLAQQDLYHHLEEAEYLAEDDDWTEEQAGLVRDLVPELVMIIRSVISAHRSDNAGHCLTCELPWPCQVLATVHSLVKHPDHHFVQLVRQSNEG
jgi:hypothetical protein